MARIEDRWGPPIDVRSLRQLYAPQEIRPFTPTPAGIDNLALTSVDTFLIRNNGGYQKHEVHFDGYFQVARGQPTTDSWSSCEVYVNMTDIVLHAKSEVKGLGRMKVHRNPDVLSAGQTFAAGGKTAAAACRIAASVVFEVPDRKMSLFNKEPVLLMNGGIKSIPPVEDPNGTAHNYLLPLYSTSDPNGRPVAYLESLRYTVGNYLTQQAVEAIRAR